jgi:hypothetical protein
MRSNAMTRNSDKNPAPIVGAWQLVSFEIRNDDGEVTHPFGEDAKGTIIYTESGRFSVQLMRSDRPHFASGDQMRGTPEEIESNYRGAISYYGAYELDRKGGYVLHHVEGSVFPNWEGQSLKRYYELAGQRLELRTPPMSRRSGGVMVGIIKWERVERRDE